MATARKATSPKKPSPSSRKRATRVTARATPKPRTKAKPRLLSGGNPQIPKADGDAPVQAYVAALSGWKHDLTRRVDALVTRTVPGVRKAVKWNSPFYGVEGQGWFLSLHVFTRYLKVTFFKGTSLRPVPECASKAKEDALRRSPRGRAGGRAAAGRLDPPGGGHPGVGRVAAPRPHAAWPARAACVPAAGARRPRWTR